MIGDQGRPHVTAEPVSDPVRAQCFSCSDYQCTGCNGCHHYSLSADTRWTRCGAPPSLPKADRLPERLPARERRLRPPRVTSSAGRTAECARFLLAPSSGRSLDSSSSWSTPARCPVLSSGASRAWWRLPSLSGSSYAVLSSLRRRRAEKRCGPMGSRSLRCSWLCRLGGRHHQSPGQARRVAGLGGPCGGGSLPAVRPSLPSAGLPVAVPQPGRRLGRRSRSRPGLGQRDRGRLDRRRRRIHPVEVLGGRTAPEPASTDTAGLTAWAAALRRLGPVLDVLAGRIGIATWVSLAIPSPHAKRPRRRLQRRDRSSPCSQSKSR